MFHRIIAALCAAALTFGVVGMAAATTVTETFTVSSSVSLSGVPASIDYGLLVPGTPSSSPVAFQVTVSANVPWRVDLAGSAFTGPGALTSHAREIRARNVDAGVTNNIPAYTPFDAFGALPALSGAATGSALATLDPRINAPAGTPAGAYSGSFTVVISAS